MSEAWDEWMGEAGHQGNRGLLTALVKTHNAPHVMGALCVISRPSPTGRGALLGDQPSHEMSATTYLHKLPRCP